MDWNDVKKELLQDDELRKAYEKIDLSHSIGKMITDARIAKKMTQSTLAQLVGTQQPSIARLEKGGYLPSLGFLERIAEAFGTQLLPPRFKFMARERNYVINFVVPYQFITGSWVQARHHSQVIEDHGYSNNNKEIHYARS